jgi:hypothetical protein
MNRTHLSLPFLLLLAGCAQLQESVRNPDSLFFRPPVGSLVELHQDLPVPPQRTRIFIQSGEILYSGGLNTFYPSCNFEVRSLATDGQVIKAGRFIVEQVRQGSESVVQAQPQRLAALQFSGFGFFSDAPSIMRYFHFKLHSELQPQVMRLTCRGALDDAPQADFPTWPEIQQALGGVAGFILP